MRGTHDFGLVLAICLVSVHSSMSVYCLLLKFHGDVTNHCLIVRAEHSFSSLRRRSSSMEACSGMVWHAQGTWHDPAY